MPRGSAKGPRWTRIWSYAHGTTDQAVLHPIERAEQLLGSQPLLAVDYALVALGSTRGQRSEPETEHYIEVLADAVMAASSCTAQPGEDRVETMVAGRRDHLACAALLRLL